MRATRRRGRIAASAVTTDHVIVASDMIDTVGGRESGVTALDTTTGATRWALPFEGAEGGGMAVTGGLLIVATQDEGGGGRVVAFADPE